MAHCFECVSSFFCEKGDLDLDSRDPQKQNGDTEEEDKKKKRKKRNKNEGEERAENPWEAPFFSSLLFSLSFPLFLFRLLSSAPSTCGHYKNRYM